MIQHRLPWPWKSLLAAILPSMFLLGCDTPHQQSSGLPTRTVDAAAALKFASQLKLRATINTGYLDSVAWSPDVHTLASSSRDVVQFWDAETGRLLHKSEHLGQFGAYGPRFVLSWSPGGRVLAAGTSNYTIRLLDALDGHIIRTLGSPDIQLAWRAFAGVLAWSPDGRTLATSSTDGAVMNSIYVDGGIVLWNTETGEALSTTHGSGQITDIHWSPDAATLFSFSYTPIGYGTSLTAWDAATGKVKFDIEKDRHAGSASHAIAHAASADGSALAATDGLTVELVDGRSGQIAGTLPKDLPTPPDTPTSPPLSTLPPSPDTPTQIPLPTLPLPSGTVPPPIQTTGPPSPIPSHPVFPPTPGRWPQPTASPDSSRYGFIASLAWSPDSKALATYEYAAIKLWDVPSGSLVKVLSHQEEEDLWSARVVWSPDGIVLASLDGEYRSPVLRLWNPVTGEELRQFEDVQDFFWSPDGHSLAIQHEDKIDIWAATPEKQVPVASSTIRATATVTP